MPPVAGPKAHLPLRDLVSVPRFFFVSSTSNSGWRTGKESGSTQLEHGSLIPLGNFWGLALLPGFSKPLQHSEKDVTSLVSYLGL